jgi:hypothetical protein
MAGMDTRRQVMVGGDLGEQGGQLSTFFGSERGAEVVFVVRGRGREVRHGVPARIGQHDQSLSSVVRVLVTADQSGLLELVEDHDEPAGPYAEGAGELRLVEAASSGDEAEDPGLGSGHAQRGDPFREQPSTECPDLGEQESDPLGVSSLCSSHRAHVRSLSSVC